MIVNELKGHDKKKKIKKEGQIEQLGDMKRFLRQYYYRPIVPSHVKDVTCIPDILHTLELALDWRNAITDIIRGFLHIYLA